PLMTLTPHASAITPLPHIPPCKARPSLSGKSPERPGDKAPGGGRKDAVDVRLRRALPSPASKTAPPGPSGILFPVRHEEGLSPLRFLFLKVADHLVEIRIPLLEHLPQPPVFRITGDLPVSAVQLPGEIIPFGGRGVDGFPGNHPQVDRRVAAQKIL